MSTSSLTVVEDDRGQVIVAIYRHCDGYYSGHGAELADFLTGFKIVNGIRGDEQGKFANGLECLAAQIVAHFKKKPGGIYLYPLTGRDVEEDFVYTVSRATPILSGEPTIKVDGYFGPASGFSAFVKSQSGAEGE